MGCSCTKQDTAADDRDDDVKAEGFAGVPSFTAHQTAMEELDRKRQNRSKKGRNLDKKRDQANEEKALKRLKELEEKEKSDSDATPKKHKRRTNEEDDGPSAFVCRTVEVQPIESNSVFEAAGPPLLQFEETDGINSTTGSRASSRTAALTSTAAANATQGTSRLPLPSTLAASDTSTLGNRSELLPPKVSVPTAEQAAPTSAAVNGRRKKNNIFFMDQHL